MRRLVFYDKENDLVTISLLGGGGPIISAKTFEEASTKFDRALALSLAVQKLLNFKENK